MDLVTPLATSFAHSMNLGADNSLPPYSDSKLSINPTVYKISLGLYIFEPQIREKRIFELIDNILFSIFDVVASFVDGLLGPIFHGPMYK